MTRCKRASAVCNSRRVVLTRIVRWNGDGVVDTMVSLTALADPTQHYQLFEYLQKLKADPNGWRNCVENIVKENFSGVEEHFVLLQVIESYLVNSYAKDDSGQQTVRLWMSSWIQKIASSESPPNYLSNKMAQLFALVFAADFPIRWPQFMQEVFLQQLDSPAVVVFFLRTLMAIDSEVVDREIQRTKEVFDRNTQIKDAMRDLCIVDVARVWTTILKDSGNDKARELCLDVIACYVDWIDIELVVNDTMVPLIIGCLNDENASESAVRAICAIIEKGMDAQKKFALVSALSMLLQQNGSLSITPGNDAEEVMRSGMLLSAIGCALIDCHVKFGKDNETARRSDCDRLLEGTLAPALQCFSHEDLDASQTVIEFLRQYVCMLKGEPLSAQNEAFINELVAHIVHRYKAPEDINLENDGENELDFLEYRKQLRSLLSTVGTLKPDIIVNSLEPSVRSLCGEWAHSEVAPIEAVLSLIYSLAEIIQSTFIMSSDDVSTRAKSLILQVLSSDVSRCGAFVVNTTFFEIVCRYDRLLAANHRPLPSLLEAFLDARGLLHPSARLRTRVVYLFCRFVKAHKQSLGDYVGTVLTQLAPLLAVNPNANSLFSDDDQMFLYEATSTLIVFGSLKVELKEQYMKELAGSLLQKFLAANEELCKVTNSEDQQKILCYMSNIIGYSSRITKAFTTSNSMISCNCASTFYQIMNTYLEEVPVDSIEMLDALRQYLHRMVACFDEQLLPALPSIFNKFLSAASNHKTLHDFLILAQQIFAKLKSKVLNSELEVRTLFELLWSVHSSEHDLADEVVARNLCYLNRAYLQMVLSIVVNDLLPLLSNNGQEFMRRLSASILAFCTCSDTVAQKVALSTVAKLFSKFCDNGTIAFVESSVWEQSIITTLQVPLALSHDPADAQCVLVQHEASMCLQVLRMCLPERFDAVIHTILPSEVTEKISNYLSTLKVGLDSILWGSFLQHIKQ
uniref:Exportin-T n=1 Tax=Ascaris lumbricoides TaxID=6252 RepID=A0A0M3I8N8_ASCLU